MGTWFYFKVVIVLFFFISNFPDISDGYPHILHSFICNCWWCDGCTGSVRRGINISFPIVLYELFILDVFFFDLFHLIVYLLLSKFILSVNFQFLWLVDHIQLNFWQIRSPQMVHKRFESFPEAFAKNLVSSETKKR